MDQRLKLHNVLVEFLDEFIPLVEGANKKEHVYFQPPSSKSINYPCIIYKLNKHRHRFANNKLYLNKKEYSLTVVDRDPDTEIPEKLLEEMPLISFDRHYSADNLNHYVFRLYF